MTPATAKAGTAELMACLTLVATSGMSAEDRLAWVAVAKQTLSGIPAELLQWGCQKARETCRFASEIVPTIMEDARSSWEWRKKALWIEQTQEAMRDAPRLPPPPAAEAVPHEETQRILKEIASAFPSHRQ